MCFPDLKGNRIILSSIDKSGLDDMYEYSKNPLLYKYLEFEPQKSINETRDYLIKLISRSNVDNAHYWFIRLTENRKVIGTFGVHDIDWRKQSAEISYGISPDYWGKGHIFEATGLVLEYCFETLNMERINAVTRKDNLPSISVLKTAGFEIEGNLREYYLKYDKTRHDAAILGLLKRNAKLTRCRVFAKILCWE